MTMVTRCIAGSQNILIASAVNLSLLGFLPQSGKDYLQLAVRHYADRENEVANLRTYRLFRRTWGKKL